MKTIVIRATQQMVEIETPQGRFVGQNVERALSQAAPSAPDEKLYGAAEVLEGMLGPLEHQQVHEGLADA